CSPEGFSHRRGGVLRKRTPVFPATSPPRGTCATLRRPPSRSTASWATPPGATPPGPTPSWVSKGAPNRNRPSPRGARCSGDDEFFYVGAELEEPHVWATLTQHDAVIFHDNDFEVFIDPNGDNHEYYEFEINAFNTGWDLLLPRPYKDGGKAVNSWEIPGLKT